MSRCGVLVEGGEPDAPSASRTVWMETRRVSIPLLDFVKVLDTVVAAVALIVFDRCPREKDALASAMSPRAANKCAKEE